MCIKMLAMSKRYRIEHAAVHLFKKQGVEATSVNEIVKLADVAKGTFYIYYKDKKELIVQILTKQHGCLLNNILNQTYSTSMQETKEWKFAFVDELILHYVEYPMILKTTHRNITSLLDTEEHRMEVLRHIERLDAFLEVLARNQESKRQTMNRFMLMIEIIGIVCYNAIFFQHPDDVESLIPEIKLMMKKMIENEGGTL